MPGHAGALQAAAWLLVNLPALLSWHAGKDWGDLRRRHRGVNGQAIQWFLPSYRFAPHVKFWVIIEGDGTERDRHDGGAAR